MSNTVTTPVDVNVIFDALSAFINRRPGLDWRDYGADGKWAYRSELRSIAADRKRAVKVLDEARGLQPGKPELLLDSFRAFSGRLQWKPDSDYCYMCGAQLHEEERTWGKHSAYGTANHPVCSQACAIADYQDAKMPHKLEYCTGQYFPTEYRKAAASVLERYIAAWRQWYASEHPKTFTYRTIEDVIAANREIGHHYFDRSTMRAFNSKVESGAVAIHDESGQPARARFITSERMNDEHPRLYTIREAQPDGTIETVGEFQQYRTRDAARKDLLKEVSK